MVGKQVIIDDCPYQGECSIGGCKRNDDGCFVRQLFEERDRAEKQNIELNKTIQAKQQECERLEETNNTLTITREKLLGDLCIVEESLKDYTEHYNRQSEEVDQLKTENEKLKKELSTYGATGICETCTEKSVLKCDQLEKEKVWLQHKLIQYEKDVKDLNYFAMKLKQTLTEIKPILELYANTKAGEEQLDGTYKIIIKESKVLGGSYLAYYDPRPAKQALQKISGCEVK